MRKTTGDIFLIVFGLWIAVVPYAEIAGVVAGTTVDRLVAGMFEGPRSAGWVMTVFTSCRRAMGAMAVHTIHRCMDLGRFLFFNDFEPMLPFMAMRAKLTGRFHRFIVTKSLVPEGQTGVVRIPGGDMTDFTGDSKPGRLGNRDAGIELWAG